jgi:hypothetical protein
VTATDLPGGQVGGRKMATEGHKRGQREDFQQQQRNPEMDKEFVEIRARMEELALRVQRDARVRWVYE